MEYRLHRQAIPRRELRRAHAVPACNQPQVVSTAHAVCRIRRVERTGSIESGMHRRAELPRVEVSGGSRHHQMTAGQDPIRGKPIDLLEHCNGGPVAVGDASERISTCDVVADPVPAIPGGLVLRKIRSEPLDGVAGELQQVRAVGVGGPAPETRIERVDVVERDAGEVRRGAQVDLAVEGDRLELHAVRNRLEDDSVSFRIIDDGGDGEQARYVSPCLSRQPQRPDVRRLASRTISGYRASDVAFAPVVGGDREQAVSVEIPQELGEIGERGVRRRDDIAAAVVPPVLLQSVQSSGRRHELPQPRCAFARVRVHLEGALDHRQQRELDGQLLLLDFAHDVRQVRSRPS